MEKDEVHSNPASEVEVGSTKTSRERKRSKPPTAKQRRTKRLSPNKDGKIARPKQAQSKVSSEQMPRRTLEESLRIPRVLREVYHGGPASWEDIANALKLGLRQENKYFLWAAQGYGVIEKEGESFKLSETGRKILAPTQHNEDREAIVKAVLTPVTLSRFFTDYNGSPFPADEHLGNLLEVRYGIPRDRIDEAKRIIKENGVFSGIIQPSFDGTLVVSLEPSNPASRPKATQTDSVDQESPGPPVTTSDFSKMCFIVTPIGEDSSQERKHADLILKSIIEPVLGEFGLTPRRADQIDKSGIITQQIFECLTRAKLCIADLSFGNPNAFYELGIRHMSRLAAIQIIRKGDKIPFDVSQGRTIRIDMTDVYTVVESIESAKRELREHVKHAISGEYKGDDNPVNVYLPGLEVRIPK